MFKVAKAYFHSLLQHKCPWIGCSPLTKTARGFALTWLRCTSECTFVSDLSDTLNGRRCVTSCEQTALDDVAGCVVTQSARYCRLRATIARVLRQAGPQLHMWRVIHACRRRGWKNPGYSPWLELKVKKIPISCCVCLVCRPLWEGSGRLARLLMLIMPCRISLKETTLNCGDYKNVWV